MWFQTRPLSFFLWNTKEKNGKNVYVALFQTTTVHFDHVLLEPKDTIEIHIHALYSSLSSQLCVICASVAFHVIFGA